MGLPLPFPTGLLGTEAGLKAVLTPLIDLASGPPVLGGIQSYGDAAAYAWVWEYGNIRQTKQGPKTVLGVNPNGEQVWLSIQAPFGYIAIHNVQFQQILNDELGKAKFLSGDPRKALEDASYRAAQRMVPLIEGSAPIDTGALGASILALYATDPDLRDDPGGSPNAEFD